jgi:hypothetical protein
MAGRFSPSAVVIPPLPENATRSMQDAAEFYRLVRGVRLEADLTGPVPMAYRWVGAWLDLPARTAGRNLRALVTAGVLVRCESLPPRGWPIGTATYLERLRPVEQEPDR